MTKNQKILIGIMYKIVLQNWYERKSFSELFQDYYFFFGLTLLYAVNMMTHPAVNVPHKNRLASNFPTADLKVSNVNFSQVLVTFGTVLS